MRKLDSNCPPNRKHSFLKGGTNVFSPYRARYFVAALLLATSACGGNHAVPVSGIAPDAGFEARGAGTVDTTSILKQLAKTVTIGSTVDAKNGDKAPHGLMIAKTNTGKIKKGQLVACNYSNKSNAAGLGTTIEALNAKAGSKALQVAQNAAAKGCAALSTSGSVVFDATFSGKSIASYDVNGSYAAIKSDKTGSIVEPFGTAFGSTGGLYPTLVLFATDASTGQLLSIDVTNFPSTPPSPPLVTPIVQGFAVNKKAGIAALGPAGLSYNAKIDTIYVVDGVDNTLIAIKGAASNLREAGAVTVLPGGKTFKYKSGITPCASVVYSGSALKQPVASALLPNGNLIVANASGSSLVEITTAGAVLATKVVQTGSAPAVYGLAASGTTDANTVLYYTNAVTNTVQELVK
jgi:hypothetical protein